VFDMGGVLVEWDPRHVYRTLLPDDHAIDAFFARVPLFERNYRDNDRGVPIASTVEELCALHPDDEHLIRAWGEHYPTMARRVYDDVVGIVAELHARGLRLLALSNAPLEMEATWRAFDFCRYFEGFVISGEEGVVKPEPEIFQVLIDRFGVDPANAVFVDDVQANIDAGVALGFEGVLFESAEQLRRALEALLR
jgi:HAD superfamily hydrolase (TIGR01509 family)